MTIKLLGVAGSLRAGSVNKKLLALAASTLPSGVGFDVFDIGEIPLYNGDVEAKGFPAAVVAFRQAIKAADGLVIATPEYNYSIPGVLKNAIDWASRPPEQPFTGKPLAIMGTAGWQGSARAQYHLRQVAVCLDMLTLNKPEVQIPMAATLFDADGNLTRVDVKEKVAAQMAALVAWIQRLNPAGA